MKVAIGSDHGGFDLKEHLVQYLQEKGYEVVDLGTHNKESVDYPEYGQAVGEAIMAGQAELGIVVCGTGLGISMAANKVKGIRAAVVSEEYSARMARAHNNANIIALGGRVVGPDLASSLVEAFLTTAFEGGRHERRVNKIIAMEEK